jgi:hypothetical protein
LTAPLVLASANSEYTPLRRVVLFDVGQTEESDNARLLASKAERKCVPLSQRSSGGRKHQSQADVRYWVAKTIAKHRPDPPADAGRFVANP